MEDLGLISLILLAGIMIGGALVRTFSAPRAQRRMRGYPFPGYPPTYDDYDTTPSRPLPALPVALVFLAILLALIFFGLRREQIKPSDELAPVERPRDYPGPKAALEGADIITGLFKV